MERIVRGPGALALLAVLLGVVGSVRVQEGLDVVRPEDSGSGPLGAMVADLTAFLGDRGWHRDRDLAPGAIAAWDKPVPGGPLRRLTLTPMDLTDDPAALARDLATQIRGELLGEPEVATSAPVDELRFALRMPNGEIAMFWMRGFELAEDRPVVLLSTLDLGSAPAEELRTRADAFTPDLQPAYDWLVNRVVAHGMKERGDGALELAGRVHAIELPGGWEAAEPKGALRRWRGPHGATAELRAEIAASAFSSPGARAARRLAADEDHPDGGELPATGSYELQGVPRGGVTAGRFALREGVALVLEVVLRGLSGDAGAGKARWAETKAFLDGWTIEPAGG